MSLLANRWSHKAVGKMGVARRFLSRDRGEPIILMYHGVAPGSGHERVVGDDKFVERGLFREQLKLLAERRRVVPLATLVSHLVEGYEALGMVSITFDDGYLNNFEHAAPMLVEFGMCATFFLATGFIGVERWAWTDHLEFVIDSAPVGASLVLVNGKTVEGAGEKPVRLGPRDQRGPILKRLKSELKELHWKDAETRVRELGVELDVPDSRPPESCRFMTWDHARTLAEAGFEIGAHTINHAILSRVPLEAAEGEILGSQERVRAEIGGCARTFCYPNGKATDFNRAVMDVCSRSFEAALSAIPGVARGEDRFAIRRIGVDRGTSPQRLAARILEGA